MEVTFALDANGILNVSARDTVTEATAQAEIKADRGRLTDEEIERMIAEADKFREQDEEAAAKSTLRNVIEETLYTCMGKAKEKVSSAANDELKAEASASVKELNEMRDWLELDSDEASMDNLKSRAITLNDRHGASIMF